MSSSKKTPEAERFGGPGSSDQNRKHPEKSDDPSKQPGMKEGSTPRDGSED